MEKLERLTLKDISTIIGVETEKLIDIPLSTLYELVRKKWEINAASMDFVILIRKTFA